MATSYCFLWLAEYYSIVSVCVYLTLSHTFFTHSSVECLGCLHILAVINNTAVNTGLRVFFWISVFIFFGYIPKWLSQVIVLLIFLIFWEILFLHQFTVPPIVYEGSLPSHPRQCLLCSFKNIYIEFTYLWLFWAFTAVCGLSLGGATGRSSLAAVTSLVVDTEL